MLADKLIESGRVAHVALVGHPGVGKTTVAAAVVKHPDVTARFEIVRLDGISRTPDMTVLYRRAWDDIHGNRKRYPRWLAPPFDPQQHREEIAQLCQSCTLLLLDDVWTAEDYQHLCLICGEHEHSRVLVTSREKLLLAEMPDNEKAVFTVPALDFEPARALLCHHAFAGFPPPTEGEWVSLIKNVVERCERLPLALTVCTRKHCIYGQACSSIQ